MNTRVGTRGQITIPAALRRKFGIRPGTRIVVEVDEDSQHIVLTPITREYIHRLRGKLRGSGLVKVLLDERAKDRERGEAKFNRSW